MDLVVLYLLVHSGILRHTVQHVPTCGYLYILHSRGISVSVCVHLVAVMDS